MLDFQTYMMRYGEHGVQAILENMERYEKVRVRAQTSLEERWNSMIRDAADQEQRQAV